MSTKIQYCCADCTWKGQDPLTKTETAGIFLYCPECQSDALDEITDYNKGCAMSKISEYEIQKAQNDFNERVRAIVRMLGNNPADVTAIESLAQEAINLKAKLADVTAERDALAKTLEYYANPHDWFLLDQWSRDMLSLKAGASGHEIAEAVLAEGKMEVKEIEKIKND